MAYQPIFAKLTDGVGSFQTHSCRGLVTSIHGWFNSDLGEVADVHVTARRTDILGPRGGKKGQRTEEVKMTIIPSDGVQARMEGDRIVLTLNRNGGDKE